MTNEQLQRQLRDLAAAQTPLGTMSDPEASDAGFLKRITVGRTFIALAKNTAVAVRALPKEQNMFKSVFVGTFGSGKTHMALILYHALKRDRHQLIATFDFSKLNGDPHIFQYLLITGLRWQGHYGYQSVCRALFARITRRLGVDTSGQIVNAGKAIAYGIYVHLIDSAQGLASAVGQVLNRGLGDEIKEGLRNNTLNQLIERYRSQTSHEFIDFVEALSDLAANPDAYSGQFEDAVRALSAKTHGQFQLTDFLFRLIRFAGFQRIILIGDELEALEAYDEAFVKHMLATLRDFHDECAAQASAENYPAIAFIFFSTAPFLLDTVQFSDSGLWRRLENHILDLPEPEIESSVKQLVELAQQSELVVPNIRIASLIDKIKVDRERVRQQNRPYVMSNFLERLFAELRRYLR